MEDPNPLPESAETVLKHALPITGTVLPGIEFESPLGEAKRACCSSYSDLFYKAAKLAESEGRTSEASLLRSLAIVCSFSPNYQDSAEPYRPQLILGDGRRSMVPDDLTPDDLAVVRELFVKSKSPALRARLGDVLWIKERDHKAAKSIIEDYLMVAKSLLTPEDWVSAFPLFRRALQLAAALGRKNEAWLAAESAFVEALESEICDTERAFPSYMFQIAWDMGVGDPIVFAQKAMKFAEKAFGEKDSHNERIYRLHEAQFWKRSKEVQKEDAARLAAAHTYIAEAEACLQRKPASYLAASGFLAQGIEALRQARADPASVAELRQRLIRYQRESRKEFQTIRTPTVDLTEAAKSASDFVDAPSFVDALKLLSFGHDIVDVVKLRSEVLKNAENAPLSHLFETGIVDGQGRVVEKLGGLLLASGADLEAKLEPHMFRQAANFDWAFRVHMFIEPARIKIWQEHRPTPSDFEALVIHNPFVPPGHERIYSRGLFYGLAGDMLLASHLLTPQLENSIRHVLELKGVDVSNLESDLTQPVKILGPLFDLPETQEIFGPNMCFELRGHLIEKSGYSFRNLIAHGFVDEAQCYSVAAMNVWWLSLRLCFLGLLALEKDAPVRDTEPDDLEELQQN